MCEIMKVNSSTHHITLQKLYQQKIFCDVNICVNEVTVFCHACILASCSSYFRERLNLGNFRVDSQINHWCTNRPLVININEEIKELVDICTVCVFKVIEFMYLSELVIDKDHIEHVSKIVRIFNIVDLLPSSLENKTNTEKVEIHTKVSESSEINNIEGVNNNVSSDLSLNNDDNNDYIPEKGCDSEERIVLKYQEDPSRNTSRNSASLEHILFDHNYGIQDSAEQSKRCEFVCCNTHESFAPVKDGKEAKKRILTCEVCTLETVSVRKMLNHIKHLKHYGNICALCYLKLPNIKQAEEHLKEHSNPKPYFCHICDKRNRHWEFHKMHFKVHCKNKEFVCKVCQKSFRHKRTLVAHMKAHEQSGNTDLLSNTETTDASVAQTHVPPPANNVNLSLVSNLEEKNNSRDLIKQDVISNKTSLMCKKFSCQLCSANFTLKKNLERHARQHLATENFKCPGCKYQTKRSDHLKLHMKKYHKELPVHEIENKRSKKKSKTEKPKESPIVGVMIPVQLVSTNDSLTINGFAVRKDEQATKQIVPENIEKNNTNICKQVSDHINNQPLHHVLSISPMFENNDIVKDSSTNLVPQLESRNDTNIMTVSSDENKLYCTGNGTEPNKERIIPGSENYNMPDTVVKCSNSTFNDIENNKSENISGIWLNEATGELINVNNFLNVHLIESSVEKNNAQNLAAESSSLNMNDPLQALIINELGNRLPLLDFGDETDNFQSNPQTPQTNVVEIEDTDNFFSWNYLDDSFYSTWVLNEATGELNMVSFNMQPLKDSTLKMGETTNSQNSTDDDDTALFLNEGTGDLSVIYFNPNKCHYDNFEQPSEQMNQETVDNMSEHSVEDRDDLLNEEFLIASANFMAYEENETFLNELTGEFDSARLSQYRDCKEDQPSERQNMYLNEETGEISWNVLDKNIGRDFFTNSESLNFDFNESLNYEDFDLAEDINDFQSNFCLDQNISSDWQDEPCDTLLNECTGELITKQ